MGDAGRELTERRELLLGDHLFLHLLEIFQRLFQRLIFRVQLLGQLLDQIQPLHFERVAPEHLQGVGHVGHLIVTPHLDRHLQVAARHGAHRGCQPNETADQVTAHEQPADEESGRNAQNVDQGEEQPPGSNRGLGGVAHADGLVVDVRHQAVHRGEKQDGRLASSCECLLLLFQSTQDLPLQRDDSLAGFPKARQALQIFTEGVVWHACRQPLVGASKVLHGAAEATLQDRQVAAVGKKQHVPQQQGGQIGLMIHGDQVPVIRQLGLGGSLIDRAGFILQVTQPLYQVKALVVGGDDEVVLDNPVRLGELLPELFQGAGDGKTLGSRFLYLTQVEVDVGKLPLDVGEVQPDIGTVHAVHPSRATEDGTGFHLAGFEFVGTVLKLVDQVAKEGSLLGQRIGYRLVFLQRRGRNEMERPVDHNTALARHAHGATQVGDAGFRQSRAVLENLMEGIVSHKACAQRQENADQKAQKELLPDAEVQPAALFRLRPVCGRGRLRRER